jgi:hypothetical protein
LQTLWQCQTEMPEPGSNLETVLLCGQEGKL